MRDYCIPSYNKTNINQQVKSGIDVNSLFKKNYIVNKYNLP